jgi:transposase
VLRGRKREWSMSWKYRRCCGIDVHKDQVTVCVLPPDGQKGEVVVKVYRTFTENLRQLRFWLQALKVTEVAMESTGVYWRPVWNVLEGYFRLLLVNPAQVKALLGRKSDRRDARRIAEFLRDQRLDASFVPPPEIRYLRELLRDRVSLVEERTRVGNQIRALLETANIKLGSGERCIGADGAADPDGAVGRAVGCGAAVVEGGGEAAEEGGRVKEGADGALHEGARVPAEAVIEAVEVPGKAFGGVRHGDPAVHGSV